MDNRKKNIRLLAAILGILLVAAAFYGMYSHYEKELQALYGILSAQKEPEPQPDLTDTLAEEKESFSVEELTGELQLIGRMETAEYNYTAVGVYDKSRSVWVFDIPGTKTRYVYSYDGRVIAGIDFSAVDVEIDETEQLVIIYIPPAEILSSSIDEGSFQVYDEKQGLFNPVRVEEFSETKLKMQQEEEEKAIRNGLLENAENNAVTILGSFTDSLPVPERYNIRVIVDRNGEYTTAPKRRSE